MKLLWSFFAATVACCVNTNTVNSQEAISIKGPNAEYTFQNSGKYNLEKVLYKGKTTGLKGNGTLYQLVEDIWNNSSKMPKEWCLDKFESELQRDKKKTRFIVKASGKNIKVKHVYELNNNSDCLNVYTTFETLYPHRLRWCYMDAFSFPAKGKFIRGENIAENGNIHVKTKIYEKSPFFNSDGTRKYIKPYNFKINPFYNEPFVGFFNEKQNCGIVMAVKPEAMNLHFFRAGQGKPEKDYYASLLNEKMAMSQNGKWYYMNSSMEIHPFENSVTEIDKTITAPLFDYLHKRGLAFAKNGSTGTKISNTGKVDFWFDYPTATILKSEKTPAQTTSSIQISLAGGETEGLQLVLNPKQTSLNNLTLSFSEFSYGKHTLPVDAISYNPLKFFTSKFARNSMSTTGQVPDILLPPKAITCPANSASVFFLRASVPYNTPAGIYRGKIIVKADNKKLFELPLNIKVWNFSLPEKVSIMSHPDIWDAITQRMYPDPAKAQKAIEDCNNLLKYARSARRWVVTPKPLWDKDGKLLKIDFSKFDKAVEQQFSFYNQPYVITRAFMLGYGHKLRNNLFGSKDSILTDKWKNKITSYAKLFLVHLKKKGWQDKVILDLFDEPGVEETKYIKKTIKLLRKIYPKWQFTAPTYYIPALNGSLNYWNFPHYYPSIAEPLKKQGDQVTLYNPPYVSAGCSLASMRAYGCFLHKYNIKYNYQWCINIWREWKERSGLDVNRAASWIAPGPNGVLSTMRFETMRDYLEDYELLLLLEKAIARAAEKNLIEKVKAGKALLKEAATVARVPDNELIPYIAVQNPAIIPELHDKIGEFINSVK